MPKGRVPEPKLATAMRVVSELGERIQAGVYAEGKWLPPERVLAEEFEVSRAVIRSALAELEQRRLLVRPAGCRPIINPSADAVVNFRKEPGAQRKNLALVLPHTVYEAEQVMMLRGVQRGTDLARYRILSECLSAQTEEAAAQSGVEVLERMARDADVAGIILWYNGGAAHLPLLLQLREAGVRFVLIDRSPPEEFETDFVGVDNRYAAHLAVDHLIDRGHRRIAHVTHLSPVSTLRDRLIGYREALIEEGLPYRPEFVATAQVLGWRNESGREEAEAIVASLLALPEPPTALFAATDHIAIPLVAALRAHGKRVPEEVAVVGFDDLERFDVNRPFLTTMRQPFDRISLEAARLLCKRIESDPQTTYRHLMLDAQLIVREST